jgi:hypothetical protein
MSKQIPLTQNKFALVDDADYGTLAKHKWYASGNYACRDIWVDGKKKVLWMHRVIMNAPEGMDVDHINGNGLDNRRSCNLRVCTRAQNLKNMRKPSTNTSGYKGVSFNKQTGRWSAYYKLNSKKHSIGEFDTPEEAAAAYDVYASKHYGEFARLNATGVAVDFHKVRNRKYRNNTSGYRGVSFVRAHGRWRAVLSLNGTRLHIGYYETARDAAIAYNTEAVKHLGQLAKLNVVTDGPETRS